VKNISLQHVVNHLNLFQTLGGLDVLIEPKHLCKVCKRSLSTILTHFKYQPLLSTILIEIITRPCYLLFNVDMLLYKRGNSTDFNKHLKKLESHCWQGIGWREQISHACFHNDLFNFGCLLVTETYHFELPLKLELVIIIFLSCFQLKELGFFEKCINLLVCDNTFIYRLVHNFFVRLIFLCPQLFVAVRDFRDSFESCLKHCFFSYGFKCVDGFSQLVGMHRKPCKWISDTKSWSYFTFWIKVSYCGTQVFLLI